MMKKHAAIITAAVIAAAATALAQGGIAQITGGSFVRGGNDGKADERPARNIEMTEFGMTAKEITEAQYQKCVDAGKCAPAHYGDGRCLMWNGRQFARVVVPPAMRSPDHPVVCVTWQQARAYCAALGMRLPTEAQWEYAALGGSAAAKYSWGNAAPSAGNCGISRITSAGSFPPNKYGLYDMTGNVWEWTSDFYAADYYENSESADPRGPSAGYYRVIRGGGWYSGPNELRVKNRHWFAPTSAEVSVGFRCVKY